LYQKFDPDMDPALKACFIDVIDSMVGQRSSQGAVNVLRIMLGLDAMH